MLFEWAQGTEWTADYVDKLESISLLTVVRKYDSCCKYNARTFSS